MNKNTYEKEFRDEASCKLGHVTYTINTKSFEKTYYKAIACSEAKYKQVSEYWNGVDDEEEAFTKKYWVVTYEEITKEQYEATNE